MSIAASRDWNACLFGSTPDIVDVSALARAAVGEVVRARYGDKSAATCSGAPGVSGFESLAIAAVIIGLATDGNRNALFANRTPAVSSGLANTSTAKVVIFGAVGIDR